MFNLPAKLHHTKTGRAQQAPTVPWIVSDWVNFATPEVYGSQGPAQFWYDQFGNTFSVRQARSAGIIQGARVRWSLPQATTVAAAPTTAAVGSVAGSPYAGANAEVGNLIYETQIGDGTVGAARTNSLKFVKANAPGAGGFYTISLRDTKVGNVQLDPDLYATVPVAGNNITIIRPYEVTLGTAATAATNRTVGIAVHPVTTALWGFFQVAGLALCLSKGDVVPLAADQPVVNSAAGDGFVMGSAAFNAGDVGTATAACAAAAAANALSPIWLSILPNA